MMWRDPIENEIELALRPGEFIRDRACISFVGGLEEVTRSTGVPPLGYRVLTPAMVHYGQAPAMIERRQVVLDAAYQVHPERFVRSAPKLLAIPNEVWIDKPPENETQ